MIDEFAFPAVEILNEPKTMEGMSSSEYGRLATAVAERLQRFRPQTQLIIAGDFIRFDRHGPKITSWLRDTKIDPVLVDLVAVHPYREPGRPTVTRFTSRENEYAKYRAEFYGKRLIVTEIGWNVAGVGEELQANYVAEELLINHACGIDATYIYAHVSEMRSGFGIAREDQTMRPVADRIAQFIDGQLQE
jgi:hypothetical protein